MLVIGRVLECLINEKGYWYYFDLYFTLKVLALPLTALLVILKYALPVSYYKEMIKK
jgi:hypothetical protein